MNEVTRTGPSDLAGIRVVVVSNEQPGRRMAGPAIRATECARQLQASGATVVLSTPDTVDMDLGVPTQPLGSPSPRAFRRLADVHDVVITQPQRVDVAAGLHRGQARVIYDCYVPSFVEYPASILAGTEPSRRRRKLIERNQREYAAAIENGDGFLVASERQKDFLLGALGQAGRLQHPPSAFTEPYPRVAVMPFGLPAKRPPEPLTQAIKGVSVPADAVVALWTGGIWNWFDPLTVLRGLHQAREQNPRLHLVFMAGGHPSAAFVGQSAAAAALASPVARELIAEEAVVFADTWVPHDQRWAYLRDADIGVCAHFDSPETRMSFRTRLLDHLWAGLPTVTTYGGVMSDLMCERGAALGVPAQDSDEWAQALLRLAANKAKRQQMAAASWKLADEFTWPIVTEPTAHLVRQLARGDAGPKRNPGITAVAAYLAVALENRLR